MFCILWLTLTWSLVAARCLPVAPSSSSTATAAAAAASTVASAVALPDATSSPVVASETNGAFIRPLRVVSDDILRQFNLSKESVVEAQSQLVKSRQTPSAAATRSAHHQTHHHHQRGPLNATMLAALSQQKMSRERAVYSRKQEIFNHVISFVRMNGRPPSSINSTLMQQGEQVAEMLSNSGAIGVNVGRVRYLHPSCDVPKHSDEDLWTAPGSMHLYFNMSGLQARDGYQLHVASAKLRLMKYAEGEALTSEDCTESSPKDDPPVQALNLNERAGTAAFFFPASSDEEKIRVSVHNFTRPLKRHRAHKKKLLDSQMALAKESNLMELDVKLAARWWLAPNGRNFGLVVEVEDTEGQRKSATSFFRARNCSAPQSEDASRTEDGDDHSNVESPVLELTLLEIPEGRRLSELGSGSVLSTTSSDETRKRPHQVEEDATDDESSPLVEDDESERPVHRRHHHHHHRPEGSQQFEEQADEANRIQYPALFPFMVPHVKSSGSHHGKHRNGGRAPTTPSPFFRSLPAIPTLATLEDHDLMENTEPEEDVKETQAIRPHQAEMSSNHLSPQDIFIQKMLRSRGSQFGHFASSIAFQSQGHHPRKDSKRTAS